MPSARHTGAVKKDAPQQFLLSIIFIWRFVLLPQVEMAKQAAQTLAAADVK